MARYGRDYGMSQWNRDGFGRTYGDQPRRFGEGYGGASFRGYDQLTGYGPRGAASPGSGDRYDTTAGRYGRYPIEGGHRRYDRSAGHYGRSGELKGWGGDRAELAYRPEYRWGRTRYDEEHGRGSRDRYRR